MFEDQRLCGQDRNSYDEKGHGPKMQFSGLRFFDRLGFRMAFLLAVVLLPLAAVSILSSRAVLSQTAARNEAALFGETVQMASSELVLIDQARGIAESLSAVIPNLLADPERCHLALAQIAQRSALSFVGFIDVDGNVPCASLRDAPNFRDSAAINDALANPRQIVRRAPFGRASQGPVVYVLTPVFEGPSDLSGVIIVSIPQEVILDSRKAGVRGTEFLTVNIDGEVLTSSVPIGAAERFLPAAGVPDRVLRDGGTFRGLSAQGELTFYAVQPVVSGEIIMIGLWSRDETTDAMFYLAGTAFFPLIMWLTSLLVGWFVVDFLVTRHVKSLGLAMRRFAQTRSTQMPQSFAKAPVELRDMGEDYLSLTDAVVRDEANLEDALYQKNILLREVHHRVKNNLQLIASIMSMQMRRTTSTEVKEVMARLQDRVLTLATIHKSLYQTSGLASIRLDELMKDIVDQLQSLSRDMGEVTIKTDFDKVFLLPDQAVPFSLLVTEAVTNAFKYISADDGVTPTITITMRDLDKQRVSLVIENTRGGIDYARTDPHSTGLGAQLMTAFASQLGTRMDVEATEKRYRLALEFAAAPFEPDDSLPDIT